MDLAGSSSAAVIVSTTSAARAGEAVSSHPGSLGEEKSQGGGRRSSVPQSFSGSVKEGRRHVRVLLTA